MPCTPRHQRTAQELTHLLKFRLGTHTILATLRMTEDTLRKQLDRAGRLDLWDQYNKQK